MKAKVTRRGAIAVGVAAAGSAAAYLTRRTDVPAGSSGGASAERGHRLRDGRFPVPSRSETVTVAIAGGGISGLAAGWTLADAGFSDFALLELEDEIGGNARGGRNAVSPFPLGAHYLPIPNREASALRHMLGRLGMITGEREGMPVYDPYQLCADLQERLLWQGRWHEGLMPTTGLKEADASQIKAFQDEMARMTALVGQDGKPAFAIPSAHSSADPEIVDLDRQTFAQWLDGKGWTAPVLRNHVRYCMRDDYGCEPAHVSAWAGIHYFASRRGWAADADTRDNVLTWPEGNAHLAKAMVAPFKSKVRRGRIVFRAERVAEGVEIDSFDVTKGESVRTHARAAILALPHFVAARVAPQAAPSAKDFTYAPWIVANVTVGQPPGGQGAKLAWDNVSYASESLGYVVANHQSLDMRPGACVLTWYMPLSRNTPGVGRKLLLDRPDEEWRKMASDDLLAMHPELDGAIRSIDLWRWGHAMIRPTPGFISGVAPAARAAALPPFFLAHSDLSGLSLFEEAHYRGVQAAVGAMRHVGHAVGNVYDLV